MRDIIPDMERNEGQKDPSLSTNWEIAREKNLAQQIPTVEPNDLLRRAVIAFDASRKTDQSTRQTPRT